jgi:hypothetical protein
MRPTILALAAAFGAGYVLGARAGRERYEQLVEAGRTAAATAPMTAAMARGATRAVVAATELGRGVVDRARGRSEIVLPDGPAYPTAVAPPFTPPSTT